MIREVTGPDGVVGLEFHFPATERTRHMAKTITKDLEVEITASERAVLMVAVGEHAFERANLEAKVADLKALVKVEAEAIAKKSTTLRTGKETRPVQCEERLVFETNTCELVRLDTGAVVHREPMTADQRQLPIIPEEGAPKRRLRSVKKPDETPPVLAAEPNEDGEFVPETH